jgi:hypothetical protein
MAGISEQIVQKLEGWKNSAILRQIYEHVGQTINEKGITVDALSRYELQILYRFDEEVSSQSLVNQGIAPS